MKLSGALSDTYLCYNYGMANPNQRTGRIIVCPCGNEKYKRPCLIKNVNYCSRDCFNKYKNWEPWNKGKKFPNPWLDKYKYKKGNVSGRRGNNWRGGRRINKDGYVSIWNPKHPNSTKQGRILEHRLVIEKHIGRMLDSDEVVHHVDFDKTNNSINNLYLTTRKRNSKLNRDICGLIKQLMNTGAVKFDTKKGEYYL